MGLKEEGWSTLIWFCFQTTWCIRTIKISASHSLIALRVSATGPGLGFWISCGSADTLRAGYLFWPIAMSEKTMFLGACVWSKVKSAQRPVKRACSLWQSRGCLSFRAVYHSSWTIKRMFSSSAYISYLFTHYSTLRVQFRQVNICFCFSMKEAQCVNWSQKHFLNLKCIKFMLKHIEI